MVAGQEVTENLSGFVINPVYAFNGANPYIFGRILCDAQDFIAAERMFVIIVFPEHFEVISIITV